MTLYNLALKNVRSQFRNYMMYFSSMAFCVMVFYSFIAMATDSTLNTRAGGDIRIDSAMKSASVVIVLFILVFMNTANSYFVKRRKREIGLYNLLGMRKGQISGLFFLENIFLGLSSLIVGIALGILLSKLFSMILFKVIYLNVESNFNVSLEAIFYTVLVFLVILLLVSLKSGGTVYRYKLIDLFKSEGQGDRVSKVTPLTVILGVSGIAMIICGYYWASHFVSSLAKFLDLLNQDPMVMLYLLLLILVFCVVGTFLFFRSGLIMLIALSQKFKRHYYKNLNMVTTGNLRFHLRKNATTLGTIAVLCGTAIAAIGGAVAVYSFGIDSVDADSPASYIVAEEVQDQLLSAIKEADGEIENKQTIHYKVSDMAGEMYYFGIKEPQSFSQKINIMPLSDYQQLTKIYPNMVEIDLKEQEMAILGDFEAYQSDVNKPGKIFQLSGLEKPLELKTITKYAPSGGEADYGFIKVLVSDDVYQQINGEEQYNMTLINVKNSDEDEGLNQKVAEVYPANEFTSISLAWSREGVLSDETAEENVDIFSRNNYSPRYPELSSFRKVYGVLIYAAMFIGIVLLVATGSIIMLKQLGEAEDEKRRYQVLRKIGVQKSKIRSSVYRQNLFVFIMPMLVALGHAWFANRVLSVLLPLTNYFLSFVACGALLVIYLLFYLWTAYTYNQIVNE